MKTSTIVKKVLAFSNEELDKIDMAQYISTLDKLGGFKEWFVDVSGREHYRLLISVSNLVKDTLILDIGTNYGASALALGTNISNRVISYDITKHAESDNVLQSNILFKIENILHNPEIIEKSQIIMLDTAHTGDFEQEFYDHLKNSDWKGILLLDDIYLNDAMKTFWENIDKPKHNISNIGHFTGTGLVIFE